MLGQIKLIFQKSWKWILASLLFIIVSISAIFRIKTIQKSNSKETHDSRVAGHSDAISAANRERELIEQAEEVAKVSLEDIKLEEGTRIDELLGMNQEDLTSKLSSTFDIKNGDE